MTSINLADMEDVVIKLEGSVRVMALTTAIKARIEGFKAANLERSSNGEAAAYSASEFFAAEHELVELVKSQIGLE
jgi:hypothetical protein